MPVLKTQPISGKMTARPPKKNVMAITIMVVTMNVHKDTLFGEISIADTCIPMPTKSESKEEFGPSILGMVSHLLSPSWIKKVMPLANNHSLTATTRDKVIGQETVVEPAGTMVCLISM
jgi:hypothetical protein